MSTINQAGGNTLLESGFFPPCRAATTAAIVLAGLLTVDGVALGSGDRVLVKNQADATTNGIWAASSGNWVRVSDAAGNTQFFAGMAVIVAFGIVNAGLSFICTTTDDPVIIGTSLIVFASQQAVAQALQQATSPTSAALTIGAKAFTTQVGKNFSAKQWVLIYETSNPNNGLLAQITSYTGNALAVNVVATGGAGGPFTDWTIVLTNSPPAAGLQPPIGTGNVTGPGSSTAGHLPVFTDATGKVLGDSGIAPGTLASRNTIQFGDVGTKAIAGSSLADGAAPLPFIAAQTSDNLALTNDVTNPNTDILVSPGRVRDAADITNLQLLGAMLKRIDLAWAAGGSAGNRQGMLLAGSSWLASKTYHLWHMGKLGQAVTQRTRTGNVATLTIAGHGLGVGGTYRAIGVGSGYDSVGPITAVTTNTLSYANVGADEGTIAASGSVDGFDVGATQQDAVGQNYPNATLPSGWTAKQCLGSILTDGSKNVRPFVQLGGFFELKTRPNDISFTNTTDGTFGLTVPTGLSVLAWTIATLRQGSSVASANALITALDTTDDAPSSSLTNISVGRGLDGVSTPMVPTSGGEIRVRTNTSGQIRVRVATGDAFTSFSAYTKGWDDPRRRLF